MFFFEKKNQKTFVRWSMLETYVAIRARQNRQKFFASFFQKRSLSSCASLGSRANCLPRQIKQLRWCNAGQISDNFTSDALVRCVMVRF
jgi:hypothetical protein